MKAKKPTPLKMPKASHSKFKAVAMPPLSVAPAKGLPMGPQPSAPPNLRVALDYAKSGK